MAGMKRRCSHGRGAALLLICSLCVLNRNPLELSTLSSHSFVASGSGLVRHAASLCRLAMQAVAAPQELEEAKAQEAVIVDLRGAGEREGGIFVPEAIHAPWDGSSMPLENLPADKNALIVLHCAVGGRAEKGKAFLESLGYTNVLNGGGPATPEQWSVLTR
eukprot:TRINITY_DN86159_c0_g1_i1.p2 TRINITY_DN86159_c0_g1~~TRINITY_DN86159_c0_g1_i1.p2  ORF type:complete len:162 (-),score=25.74 TRINITY_DN86159_c0_g1_i1:208-693(-)